MVRVDFRDLGKVTFADSKTTLITDHQEGMSKASFHRKFKIVKRFTYLECSCRLEFLTETSIVNTYPLEEL